MTPADKQRILDAIWGDCYTKVHAQVIFNSDGRVEKIKRIEAIVLNARRDVELLKALWEWQEQTSRINAQGDNHD